MSILLPALSKAKDQAKATICFSNLRQIGMAANLYAQDWKNYVPRSHNRGSIWFKVFMDYLSQESVTVEQPRNEDYRYVKAYRCPSYPDRRQTVCYVSNGWGFESRDDMVGYDLAGWTSLLKVRSPGMCIYLADNEDGPWRAIILDEGDDDTRRCDVWTTTQLPGSDLEDVMRGRRVSRDRHRGRGANCLFFDWHVEWVSTEENTVEKWQDGIYKPRDLPDHDM
jgi:prepilin-type processing-associated H-X9-DG protein